MRTINTVNTSGAARHAGFTLVETLIALAVFTVLLALGVPRMSDWAAASKAAATGQFYAEGLALARAKALAHNSASRIILSPNADSGQYDWRVDLCFPTPEAPCNAAAGTWSTVTDPVKPDGAAGAGFNSVQRNAASLPGSERLSVTPGPNGSTAVYFTPLGWIDTRIEPRMMRIDLAPASSAPPFPAASLVLTLGGIAIECAPDVAANDSRRCPE